MMDSGEAFSPDEAGASPRVLVKKRSFVEAVARVSGQKKPVVKSVVDATLAELGQALLKGETVVLPPLGRVSVVRSKGEAGAEILVLKLRRLKDQPEADVAE